MRRLFRVTGIAAILGFVGGLPAAASTLPLQGLLGSGVTATVSNFSLVGNAFRFDLTNTSASGIISSIGVSLNDVVDATGLSTTSPFSYTLIHDGAAPPGFTLPANDFFLALNSGTGILPGSTFTYSFVGLTLDSGAPLSDISANTLAEGLSVRFVGISGPISTDIATPVPEPTTLLIVGTGLVAVRLRIRGRAAS